MELSAALVGETTERVVVNVKRYRRDGEELGRIRCSLTSGGKAQLRQKRLPLLQLEPTLRQLAAQPIDVGLRRPLCCRRNASHRESLRASLI